MEAKMSKETRKELHAIIAKYQSKMHAEATKRGIARAKAIKLDKANKNESQ